MLKIIYNITGVFLLNIGIVVAAQLTLDFSKRTAAIILLSEFILFLFVVINFLRTYHERIRHEALADWTRRMELVDILYDGKVEGRRLADHCDTEYPNLQYLLDNWNKVVANRLNKISEDHKRKFYEGSRTGEYLPDDGSQWPQWMRDRIEKLDDFITEFEQPPPQLTYPKGESQIQTRP